MGAGAAWASHRGPENRSRNSWYASVAWATAALPAELFGGRPADRLEPPVDFGVYPAHEERRHAVDCGQVPARRG